MDTINSDDHNEFGHSMDLNRSMPSDFSNFANEQ
jgi:hypothetical protein